MTCNIPCPPIEVPIWSHVQAIPAATDEGRSAVVLADDLELSAMEGEMSQEFRVFRLFNDLESEQTFRHDLGNAFLKYQAITENTLSRRADELAGASRLRRSRQADPVQPVVRCGLDLWKRNHVFPYFGRRRVDVHTILDHTRLIVPHLAFDPSGNEQHRDHT